MTTICKKLGHKVGDQFRVESGLNSTYFTEGSIVALCLDDGSSIPLFELVSGGKSIFSGDGKAYLNLRELSKV